MLDFGACRDGITEDKRGRRILVDLEGRENNEAVDANTEVDLINSI